MAVLRSSSKCSHTTCMLRFFTVSRLALNTDLIFEIGSSYKVLIIGVLIMADQKWLTTSAGVKMPRIIYGTAWKKDRTADLVVKAIQTGFRGIDTARQPKQYNEALVGTALQRLKGHGIEREALFLQTKFTPLSGQDLRQVPYDKDSPVELQVAQSFEASKENLQTEYYYSVIFFVDI